MPKHDRFVPIGVMYCHAFFIGLYCSAVERSVTPSYLESRKSHEPNREVKTRWVEERGRAWLVDWIHFESQQLNLLKRHAKQPVLTHQPHTTSCAALSRRNGCVDTASTQSASTDSTSDCSTRIRYESQKGYRHLGLVTNQWRQETYRERGREEKRKRDSVSERKAHVRQVAKRVGVCWFSLYAQNGFALINQLTDSKHIRSHAIGSTFKCSLRCHQASLLRQQMVLHGFEQQFLALCIFAYERLRFNTCH